MHQRRNGRKEKFDEIVSHFKNALANQQQQSR